MAANTALKKIQAATKKLRKENPKMDYRTAQKKASAAYNSGKLGSITKTNNKMAAQSRQMVVTLPADNNGIRANGLLAGTKKRRKMSGLKSTANSMGGIITATLGAGVGQMLGGILSKKGSNMPLAVVGAGVALQLIGRRNKLLSDAGAAMAGAGLVTMIGQRTPMLSGVNDAIDSMFSSNNNYVGATGVMFDYQEPTMGEVASNNMQTGSIPMINPNDGQMDAVDQIMMYGR